MWLTIEQKLKRAEHRQQLIAQGRCPTCKKKQHNSKFKMCLSCRVKQTGYNQVLRGKRPRKVRPKVHSLYLSVVAPSTIKDVEKALKQAGVNVKVLKPYGVKGGLGL
jgi:hypothetical protein